MPKHSFYAMLQYLQEGRSPIKGRPLERNTRVVYCEVDGKPGVGVKFHNTVVVAYLPDGTTVLNSGNWHTVTTLDRINRYSPAFVRSDFRWKTDGTKHSEYRTWIMASSVFARSQERYKPCRRCKGTGINDAQGRCWGCTGTGVRDYGSKPVCPTFEDGVAVSSTGFVVGYVGVPREWWSVNPPEFDMDHVEIEEEHAVLRAEHLPERLRPLTPQPSRGLGSVPVLSPDAQTVEFSRMSAEAQAEMDEWESILRGGK
jgi:hypothetical protein